MIPRIAVIAALLLASAGAVSAAVPFDGKPPVSGSMYNGNNVTPPIALTEQHAPAGETAKQGEAATNRGGNASATARAGGGN